MVQRYNALQPAQRKYISHAAATLGVSEMTLHRYLKLAAHGPVKDVSPVAPSVKPIVDMESLALRQQIKDLKAELSATHRETLDDKFVKEHIVGLKEKFSVVSALPWLTPSEKKRKNKPGVPTLVLSDLHWGETIDPAQMSGLNAYNIEIANQRLRRVVNRSIDLLRNHIAGVDYPGFVLCLGGDMFAGSIHEELSETNDAPIFPTMLDLFSALVSAIAKLADEFGRVYVPCVAGNHGRTTRKPRAKQRNHTNYDWLLCKFLEKHFEKDPRVTFDAPDSPAVTYQVLGHTYRLEHGDQLGRGGDGIIGSAGPILRGDHKRRSFTSQINQGYKTLIHGHFHNYKASPGIIGNGSLCGYDEYALASGFGFELPQQAFWITDQDYGITYSMPILASEPLKKDRAAWLNVEQLKRAV